MVADNDNAINFESFSSAVILSLARVEATSCCSNVMPDWPILD